MVHNYAKLHAETLDRKYEDYLAAAIDKDGQESTLISSGDATNATVERLRERLGAAVLPNGYCTLPADKRCDFRPSPCLECGFFRTTHEFLGPLRTQRVELMRLIDRANRNGQTRIVEINEPTLRRVDLLVDALENKSPTKGSADLAS